ncbi:hypothetical protein HRbin36_02747 [bacterium HR36]|nr:hypothetical protein HRbin36_02747 [bacterium HR36]
MVQVQIMEHVVQNAALHWLQTIPDVGECPRHDHRLRIIQVASLGFDDKRDTFNAFCHNRARKELAGRAGLSSTSSLTAGNTSPTLRAIYDINIISA